MTTRIELGIVAEDDTDFEALKTIARRVLGTVKVRKRTGNGCHKLRIKAKSWLQQLAEEGCTHAVVVHDLDRNPSNNALNDPALLYSKLEEVCCGVGLVHHICIPVEELEAWFWADQAVISRVGRNNGAAVASPELISKPKEQLIRLSRDGGGKPRYSTANNVQLAELLNLTICRERCPSFEKFYAFLESCRPQ